MRRDDAIWMTIYDVPGGVFASRQSARGSTAATVVLERDGRFPTEHLLAGARSRPAALAEGVRQRHEA
jgi:hypothetical protein